MLKHGMISRIYNSATFAMPRSRKLSWSASGKVKTDLGNAGSAQEQGTRSIARSRQWKNFIKDRFNADWPAAWTCRHGNVTFAAETFRKGEACIGANQIRRQNAVGRTASQPQINTPSLPGK